MRLSILFVVASLAACSSTAPSQSNDDGAAPPVLDAASPDGDGDVDVDADPDDDTDTDLITTIATPPAVVRDSESGGTGASGGSVSSGRVGGSSSSGSDAGGAGGRVFTAVSDQGTTSGG